MRCWSTATKSTHLACVCMICLMSRRGKPQDPRRKLGEIFTRSEALRAGLTAYWLYSHRDAGEITALGGGLYRWADAEPGDLDLIEIAERVPRATLCLETALARHSLQVAVALRQVDESYQHGCHQRLPLRAHCESLPGLKLLPKKRRHPRHIQSLAIPRLPKVDEHVHPTIPKSRRTWQQSPLPMLCRAAFQA